MPERSVGVEEGVSGSLHCWTRPERSQGSSPEDQSRKEALEMHNPFKRLGPRVRHL